tara:strand:- start:21810 stop:23228 length:1419 start_codon:yes stop_codon:yes gene_type:complete
VKHKIALGLLSTCSLLTAGCTITPETIDVERSLPNAYQNQPALNTSAEMTGEWWLGFEDETLTGLIESAQSENLDVLESLSQLKATYELTRAVRSDLFPTIDGFLDQRIGGVLTSGIDANYTGSTGAGLTFDPDITGRIKNRIAAADSDYVASELGVANLKRLIAEAVALQYIELRRAEARLALLESTLDLQQQTIEISEARFEAGLSPKLNVDRTRADLARTLSQQGTLISSRERAAYSLAVLTGNLPGSLALSETVSDDIPEFILGPNLAVPADLVRRRPDVRAAETRLQSELIRISIEKADLLPSLRLPGQLSAGFGDVSGSGDEIAFSLSALVDIPLFDFGRRQAEVDAQRARAESAAFAYRASVLNALQEVESALSQIEAIQWSLEQQMESVRASESAYEQLDALYREGLATFTDVLDTQRQLISGREAIVQTEANLAIAIISLYAALDAGCDDVELTACVSSPAAN